MNFDFSDEQQQLREAVEQFLAKEYPFERLRAVKGSGAGWDPQVWRGLAELGVTAINVPSSLGGLGYGPMETLVLMGACGPSLLLEPVLTSAVIATVLLKAQGLGATALSEGITSTEDLSRVLFHELLLPFEVTSILILIAILGAVALARHGHGDTPNGGERTTGK